MQKDDFVELFKRIPETSHAQVNLILRNGMILAVDAIARFEKSYVVFRGREGGTTDEGRGFFVNYDEICYIKLEQVVRIGELKRMFGDTSHVDAEDRLSSGAATTPTPSDTRSVTATPGPSMGTDPASIAKHNLLERIRSARANVGGVTGKLGGGGK